MNWLPASNQASLVCEPVSVTPTPSMKYWTTEETLSSWGEPISMETWNVPPPARDTWVTLPPSNE
ncbi:MAG: hypothetical protein JRN09_05140 [Nitrososphaerota archaeon]|nr:hypothetical protein [Nitrososphaerota archaeon]